MPNTKSKILVPIVIIAILAAILSNGHLTGSGDEYVDYRPRDGERAYDIQIGAASVLNLANLRLIINGKKQEIPLHGGTSGENRNGPGIFVRGFVARAGTTISLHVERTGHAGSEDRFGTISCYVREDFEEVSGSATNDPYIFDIACARVVGAPR